MAVVRCPQGHFYDDQRFSSCPHCGISVAAGPSPDEAAGQASGQKKKHGLFGWMDHDRTVALGKEKRPGAGENSRTVALKPVAQAEPADDQKTVGYWSGANGNDYVTGWLVCVEGPEKGRDYRLHHGFNRIGRDPGMDVQVMDDPAISRLNHCSVVYDDKNAAFLAVPGAGTLTYLRDGLLTEAVSLRQGDELRLGNSVFEFIPFCREGHVWEK